MPAFVNQLGFDLDALDVKEGTIPNDATGTSVCLGTSGDTYFFGGIAFDTLIRARNLQIAKTAAPSTANPGDVVTHTTTVSNPQRGPGETPTEPATDVVTADPVPSGLDCVDFTNNPGGACITTPRPARSAAPRAPSRSTARFSYSYRATVDAAAQGTSSATFRNVACYRASSEDQPDAVFTGCDEASVVVPPNPYVDLGVVKTVSADTVAPGATLTWTLVATNHGPGTSTRFVLADELPPGVTFVSSTADPALTCTTPLAGATGNVTCAAPSVTAGTSLTVTITGAVPASTPNGTVLTNVATINRDQPEPTPDPHPNRDEAQTRVDNGVPLPPPPAPEPEPSGPVAPPVPESVLSVLSDRVAGTRLSLHKSVAGARAASGDTVSFRLRVKNIGEAGALLVRVCDVLPRGMTIGSAPRFPAVGRALCVNVGRASSRTRPSERRRRS